MAYQEPVRRILTTKDLDIFKTSASKELILGFVKGLNESVAGCTNNDECESSAVIESVVKILDEVSALVDKHPAADQQSSRFGKLEFRDFYDELKKQAHELLSIIPGLEQDTLIEISKYFEESWGHRERIDYGSGHELNFISFLLCLKQLGLITEKDYKAVVLKVFLKYMEVIRKVQIMYWLEPAGSHGVWGLDDYHFLPFMFGSAQLTTHKYLRPSSIHDGELVDMFADKYMYLACVKFINSVKTASLRWHSPLIDDISGVKKWSKVNEGMVKMYNAEVLDKLPIIQHFMFGSLIPAPDGVSEAPKPGEHASHVHNSWGDCCGIAIPSAIAASQIQHKNELRPIPFD